MEIAFPARGGWIMPAVVIALACSAPSGATGADELLYYVDGGELVITNTPSRADVKPVPSASRRAAAAAVTAGRRRLPETPYDRFIGVVARRHGLSPDLVRAVAWVESAFDPRAVSPRGAVGLMQLMPATASRYGVRDRRDPYENLRAGTEHLRDLLDEFGGDLPLALAAYNAGAGAVRRHGGIPAYRETRDYVDRVLGVLRGDRRSGHRPPASPPARPVRLERGPDGRIELSN